MIKKSLIVYIILLCTLIFSACSVEKHRRTLSFFFDGVPTEKEVKAAPQPKTQKLSLLQHTASEKIPMQNSSSIEMISAHTDYKNKSCEKCHQVEHGYRLVNSEPDLCLTCHKNFYERYEKIHGPVAAGFCSACHIAHHSKFKALLKLPSRELCSHCHMPGDIEKNSAHKAISEIPCLDCHDAHGGETTHLLKPDWGKNTNVKN